MWRYGLILQQNGRNNPNLQRTMVMAAGTGMTTSTNKRPIEMKDLRGGGGGGGGGGGTRAKPPSPGAPSPPSSTATKASPPPPTPPPSGGGGGGMTPVLLVGAAALAGGAAYMYYNDENFANNLPWANPPAKKETEKPKTSVDEAASAAKPKESVVQPTPQKGESPETTTPSFSKKDSSAVSDKAQDDTTVDSEDDQTEEAEAPAMVMSDSSSSSSPEAATTSPPKPTDVSKSAKSSSKEEEKLSTAVDMTDTSSTKKAIEELQSSSTVEAAKTLVQSHQSLWSSLDSSYFSDLDSLSMAQLKARVVQLATEMKDRTQWEAVRLKEFLALKEKETAQQYQEILQKQRLEFEELLARRLREQEDVFHKQLRDTLDAKDANIQSVVRAALEAQQEEHNQDKEAFAAKFQHETQTALNKQYGEQMADYKQAMERDLKEKVSTLQNLSEKLRKLETALEASQRTQQGSSQAHKLSAAALALSEILQTHAPAAKEVQALKSAAGQDGVIATVVRTLPTSVTTKGVPTLPELQTKFEENYSTCRQAALVPAGRYGLGGQLAGMLFASLKYPPKPDDPGPSDEPNSAEYVLARARKHVKLGELAKAIEELEKLQGQAAFVITDWKKAAMDRVVVEKAVKVIKLECALLHESVAK